MGGDKMNSIQSYYYIINEQGDTCWHDGLNGHLLVDREILRLKHRDGTQEEVEMRLLHLTPVQRKEFGGGWHGFEHAEYSKIAIIYRDGGGKHEYLSFMDDVEIEHVNAPLGEKVDS